MPPLLCLQNTPQFQFELSIRNIIANITETPQDISLVTKFCSTAPGNNLTTKNDHKYFVTVVIRTINRSGNNTTPIDFNI